MAVKEKSTKVAVKLKFGKKSGGKAKKSVNKHNTKAKKYRGQGK